MSSASRPHAPVLVTINPGLILGPSWGTASDSGSLFLMNERRTTKARS